MSAEIALTGATAAPPARPRVLLVGTALAGAAALMAFAGLIGIYLSERAAATAGGAAWLPEGSSLPLTPGNMAFGTMLLSAITMWWAVDAVGKNDRQMAYLALGLTMFFGVATINATSFLYAQANLPVNSTPGVLIYTITGGLIDRDREGLTAAALFWYLTIAAHALVWYAIYVVK